MDQPIYAMAFAVFVGGVLQVALQIPALIKIGMLPRLYLNPMIGLRDTGVKRVLKKMGPAVFAVVGCPDQPDDQYQHRLAAGARQRIVAVLC